MNKKTEEISSLAIMVAACLMAYFTVLFVLDKGDETQTKAGSGNTIEVINETPDR